MTARQLINQLEELIRGGMPESVEVEAYDPDEQDTMPVTGFLYDDVTIELCTDDQEG